MNVDQFVYQTIKSQCLSAGVYSPFAEQAATIGLNRFKQGQMFSPSKLIKEQMFIASKNNKALFAKLAEQGRL